MSEHAPQCCCVECEEHDRKTAEVMVRFGGSFVQALGEAARRADRRNLTKLKIAFWPYWSEYAAKHDWLESKQPASAS
jgi:hypothetical protein